MRLSRLFLAAPEAFQPDIHDIRAGRRQRKSRAATVRLELSGRILLNWRGGSFCRF
jgi:hypothetical protein